jgi:hypothetical protein
MKSDWVIGSVELNYIQKMYLRPISLLQDSASTLVIKQIIEAQVVTIGRPSHMVAMVLTTCTSTALISACLTRTVLQLSLSVASRNNLILLSLASNVTIILK